MNKLASSALIGWVLALFPALALGQAPYPNRTVRMIVPFAPGGASDFVARIIAPKLGDTLGQPIVIDNRPGASGNIGMEAAARAAADGYTIYLGNVGTIAINPAIFRNLEVNPQKDFVAVTLVAEVPSILVAGPSVPASSVAELAATMDSPETRQRLAAGGVSVVTSRTPEDFASFVGTEAARWGKVGKESGATVD